MHIYPCYHVLMKTSQPHRYIFVLGGVMSGVGKGIVTASIGTLLQAAGYRVNLTKIDPYLNVDAGTMNPTEHGETFVLDSGLETDQDMGNYERFLNRSLTADDYLTSGMIYRDVIERERSLGYGGQTVEAIPHVTDEIMRRIKLAGETNKSDISVIEVGGTIGDFQNALFIEAARIMKHRAPHEVMTILVSYLPVPDTLGEMKSKPTQNAVRQLNSYGVQPDMIIARSRQAMDAKRREKIASATSVPASHIIPAPDVESIYDIPLNFARDGVDKIISEVLQLKKRVTPAGLAPWRSFMRHRARATKPLRIALVGKYLDTGDFVLPDAYVSVLEALKFSGYKLGLKPTLELISAQDLERSSARVRQLAAYDGVIVPGGFGKNGIGGKIRAVRFCREQGIPYLGLCYGMQLMVVEYARTILGWKDAHTTEIDPQSKHPVIHIMPEQEKLLLDHAYGGTMRLGAYPAHIQPRTHAARAYDTATISERHRHRYEVNNAYRDALTAAGLVFSGTSPDGRLCEITELPKQVHPFFVGTQFHPELKARPLDPHPLFTAFLKAAQSHQRD